METSLITTSKNDVRTIVKNLSEPARKAVDTVFAYAPDIAAAESRVDEARRGYEPVLCESFSKIATDKDGISKAGFKTFGDFAEAVFGLKPAAASMYKRVGDKFFNVDKRPTCAAWYSVSKLQELRNVDNATLDKDAESGALTPDMSLSALRAYADSKKSPALEDGSASVSNGFYGVILPAGDKALYPDEESFYKAVNGGTAPLADRLHVTPSDVDIITKTDKGKDKTTHTKLVIVEHDDGSVTVGRLWKNPLALSKEDAALAARIRRKLEAAGVDTSGMTAQDLING